MHSNSFAVFIYLWPHHLTKYSIMSTSGTWNTLFSVFFATQHSVDSSFSHKDLTHKNKLSLSTTLPIKIFSKSHLLFIASYWGHTMKMWDETTQEDQYRLILPLYWTTPLTIIPFGALEVNLTDDCYWGGIRFHTEGLQPDAKRRDSKGTGAEEGGGY